MDHVLVAGGAGYIGAHICLSLREDGFTPVAYDDLSNGHADAVQFGPFERGSIEDEARVFAVLKRYRPVAIVHCAASIEVGQSMRDPLAYYRNNLGGTLSLLSAAERAGVSRIVFSSTCATYGAPQQVPMSETHPQAPLSPYGRSKQMVEAVLADLGALRGLRSVVLRYFNAAGADSDGRIGERHDPETHAVPLAIRAMLSGSTFSIFGTDYETRDGTCVRDFVHVMDLADAHRRAVRHLLAGGESVSLNLGTGTGTSVAELVAAIEAVAGRPMAVRHAPRRPGDAPVLVADNARARAVLGWEPRADLRAIIESAWNWHARQDGDADALGKSERRR